MAKLLLSILLVLISGAYCQNDTTGTVTPTPSHTVPSPAQCTSAMLPTKAPNFLYNYTSNVTNLICIRMSASLGLVVEYRNTTGMQDNVTLDVAEPATVSNASFCNHTTETKGVFNAMLTLEWMYNGSNTTYMLSFYLKANQNTGKEQWNVTSVNATIPIQYNPDFPCQPEVPVAHLSAGYPYLVESLDFTRSYFCNSSRALNMTVEGNVPYNVSLNISNFQIQAFEFSNTTTYEYGSAVRCSQDIRGSKIVPIIVGAALAGLVIIVLIAYIIGRYRSRKHNSYEALS